MSRGFIHQALECKASSTKPKSPTIHRRSDTKRLSVIPPSKAEQEALSPSDQGLRRPRPHAEHTRRPRWSDNDSAAVSCRHPHRPHGDTSSSRCCPEQLELFPVGFQAGNAVVSHQQPVPWRCPMADPGEQSGRGFAVLPRSRICRDPRSSLNEPR